MLLLLAFGNVNADQQLYSGDVVLVPLQNTEINTEFFYKNNLITTVNENNKPYLLFGIPYDSSLVLIVLCSLLRLIKKLLN